MAFTLLSVSGTHLQIRSDDSHQFSFDIVKDDEGHRNIVCDPRWHHSAEPENGSEVLEQASRFASVCAEDFGLR